MDHISYIYQQQKKVNILSGITELLDWDENTSLPLDAVSARAEQSKLVDSLIHNIMTSQRLYRSLKRVQPLTDKDKVVIEELNRQVDRLRKLPTSFIEERTNEIVYARQAWLQAKKDDEFGKFMPALKKIITIKRREANYINNNQEPYLTLLQENEETLDTKKLEKLIKEIKIGIISLLNKVKRSPKYKKEDLKIEVNPKEQMKMIKETIYKIGVQKARIVFGISAHPFTTLISRNDVRITTRDKKSLSTLFDAMHEAGHALYDLNLPIEYNNTVIFTGASTGIHESQSIFWEIFMAKNPLFWETFYQQYRQALISRITKNDIVFHINKVRPNCIRLDSDILNYCLHIIIRYEIERSLINGTLKINDAAKEWNKKMKEYIGVEPKKDGEGILQDIHWADGDFGYFPTYLIGLCYAAQIYKKLQKDIPKFNKLVIDHDFNQIKGWLISNIHQKGKTKNAEEIMTKATGERLSTKPLLEYFNKLYTEIYSL